MITRLLVSAAISLGAIDAAKADFFRDVGKAITAPITAPIKAAQDIASGKPASTVVQNQLNLHVGAPAVAAGSTLNLIQKGNDFIQKVPRDVIQNNLGGDWLAGYDAITGSQRIQQEIAFTAGRFLTQCASTGACSIEQATAVPVAAAMRDAYKVYIGHSSPLSPQMIQILSRVVPWPVLQSARWTVGNTPNMTVPGFLNSGNSAFGHGHAVTLGNLMIFSQMPEVNTYSGAVWVLHELFHIEQYFRYSGNALEAIDGFAVDYIRNYDGMEREAENNAVARLNILQTGY
jgi:hypothetical protein